MIEVPASSGQSLLWFLEKRGGRGIGLNCPVPFRVQGLVDPARLRDALGQIAQRHSALRTGLARRDRRLIQIVADSASIEVTVAHAAAGPEAVQATISEEILRPVPVDRPSLRALMVPTGAETHVCLSVHHAFADGWSGQLIFDDLAQTYGGAALPAVPGFELAALREADYLASPQAARDLVQSRAVVDEADIGAVPLDRRQPARIGATAGRRKVLDPWVSARLSAFAATSGVGAFAVHLSICLAALHLAAGTLRPGIATLFANRTDPTFAKTVGFFVSMQYLAVPVSDRARLRAFVNEVAGRARAASARQRFPLHLLPRDPSRWQERLDDCVFQLLPYKFQGRDFGGMSAVPYLPPVQPRRFDFEVTAVPDDDAAQIIVNWNADRLDRRFVDQYLDRYLAVAAALADDPDRLLAGIA
jgi:hypothetical protein